MSSQTFTGQIVRQRGRILFVGSISIKKLLAIYKIDIWKMSDPIEVRGVQRNPIAAHYKKIGKSLSVPDATLPTAVVLSSDLTRDAFDSKSFEGVGLPSGMDVETLNADSDFVRITIDPDQLKLQVVDGQHRIKGIEYALERGWLSPEDQFDLPYVLILARNRYEEINNFYSINSKAKRVATDLALQLMNEMKESDPNFSLSLPEKKKVIAINIANTLTKDSGSVWYKNISQGNKTDSGQILSSTSFVTSLLPVLTIPFFNDQIKELGSQTRDMQSYGQDKAKIINNFWSAIRNIIPAAFEEQTDWVIQKTPGVYVLHKVLAQVLNDYFIQKNEGNLETASLENFFRTYASDYISPDEIDFWRAATNGRPGGEASTANSGQAFKRLSDDILEGIKAKYDEQHQFSLQY